MIARSNEEAVGSDACACSRVGNTFQTIASLVHRAVEICTGFMNGGVEILFQLLVIDVRFEKKMEQSLVSLLWVL